MRTYNIVQEKGLKSLQLSCKQEGKDPHVQYGTYHIWADGFGDFTCLCTLMYDIKPTQAPSRDVLLCGLVMNLLLNVIDFSYFFLRFIRSLRWQGMQLTLSNDSPNTHGASRLVQATFGQSG